MLNYFGNNLVPNGYVYTSHTGSKYIFLEGLWFRHSNMQMIDPRTYGNVYASAQKQIVEHNAKSSLKIGSTYIVEGKEQVFIGEGQYTINGMLVESTNDDEVPDGFVYVSPQNKKFFKKKGIWYSIDTKKPVNASNVGLITRAAVKQIKSLNRNSPVKIGQEWTSNAGKTYKYVGDDRFISADGKMIPKDMAEKVKNDLAARKDDHEEENSDIKDKVDADIDNTSTATPEDRKEEEKVDQERAIDDHDAKQDDRKEDDKLKGLADQIKSNPKARNIIVLLTRADKLSLMAADILLSGEADKAKQILQTLNNRDK